MKKFSLISSIIAFICIYLSCFDANFNNPNDKYSDVYIRNNPKLSKIVISDGILNPAFNPNITTYTINLSYLTPSITITPIAINDNSAIIINGSPIASSSTSTPFTLYLGENIILINITSEDLTETIEYKITINSYNNDFSSFTFLVSNNTAYLSEDIFGTINTDLATINIDKYFDMTNLVASFTVNENSSVKIGEILQTSGVTENDFSNSFIYTVTYTVQSSGTKISKDYTVKIKNLYRLSYLKAPNNPNMGYFGYSVSISEDTIAVGAYTENSTTTSIINGANLSGTNNDGSNNGAVYVFKKSGTIWTHEAYLKAPNNSNEDKFGTSVSISGDTIAVGSPAENSTTTSIINGANLSGTNNDGSNNGAVYVFKKSGTIWTHEAYLKAPNNSNEDKFGTSVSISGDTIAVGSPAENSTTTSIINGANLSGTNNDGSNNGAVYVFKKSGTIWMHEAYLKAPNNSTEDKFGSSVSISGDSIAVGSPNENSTTTSIINGSNLSNTNNNSTSNANGAVYVFKRSGTTWTHEAYLKAPNNLDDYWYFFGTAVSISGDTIAVGSPYECSSTTSIINGSDLNTTNEAAQWSGAVYVFRRVGTIWTHEAYLKAPNNRRIVGYPNGYNFGFSVSISGNIIAVGARYENSTTKSIIFGSDLSATNNDGEVNGAVYVFERTGSIWMHKAYLKAPNNSTNSEFSNYDIFGYSVSISGNTIAIGAPYEDSLTATIINGSDLSSTNDNGGDNGAVYVFY